MSKSSAVNDTLQLPLAQVFERDLSLLLAEERDVVLAMVDVDCFDRVNKENGREDGDRVLIETGEHLKKMLPESAKLYRFGGDEFACLFDDGTEKEDVFLLMERIRGQYAVISGDGRAQTISVGIAAAQDDANSYHDLVRKAEGAMFRGKQNGRNRVCLAREEKMVTKAAHYTTEQLKRLTKLSLREGIGEAILMREALDGLLKKYDV